MRHQNKFLLGTLFLSLLLTGFTFRSPFAYANVNCSCTTYANDCNIFSVPDGGCTAEACKTKYKTEIKSVAGTTAGSADEFSCTSIHNTFVAAEVAKTTTPPVQPAAFVIPTLNVQIPGLTFSKPVLTSKGIESSFLGSYLTAMYRYLIGISITIAIVMVMIGGFQYVLSAGGADAGKAKTRITNATVGLVLLLCVYLILYTTNPQLTILNTIALQNVPVSPLISAQITVNLKRCGELRGTLTTCTASKVAGGINGTMRDIINSIPQTDPFLLAAHVLMESGGQVGYGARRGPCGEVGPAQFMPSTAEGMKAFPGCCTGLWAPPSPKTGKMDGWTSYVKECDNNRDMTPEGPPFPKFYRGDKSAGKEFPPKYPGACGHFETASQACVDFFNSKKPDGSVDLAKVKQLLTISKDLIEKNLTRTGGDRAQELCIYNGGVPYGQLASTKYKMLCEKAGGSVTLTSPGTKAIPASSPVTSSPTTDEGTVDEVPPAEIYNFGGPNLDE